MEQAVLRALGVDHYDFQLAAPRRSIVPKRIAEQQALLEKEKERLTKIAQLDFPKS